MGIPMASLDIHTESMGVPMDESMGMPMHGIHRCISMESVGIPMESMGIPVESMDIPKESLGTPGPSMSTHGAHGYLPMESMGIIPWNP